MAVQLECEFCKDSFPEDHIIYVERLNKGHLSCHHCVNDIINKLDEDLETERNYHKFATYYRMSK